MEIYFSFSALLTAVVYLALGLLAYSLLLKPFVLMFLKAFHREIVEEKNVAFAVLVGFLSLSLSIIIAAAVH